MSLPRFLQRHAADCECDCARNGFRRGWHRGFVKGVEEALRRAEQRQFLAWKGLAPAEIEALIRMKAR